MFDREAESGGAEGAVLAGHVTDSEQFQVGLAAHQIAAGPGLAAGAGRGADLEVGELPQVGRVLDGVGGLPVEDSVGVVVEQQLPIVRAARAPAPLGLCRPHSTPDRSGESHSEHDDHP